MISVRLARSDDNKFIEALGARAAADTISAVRSSAPQVAAASFRRLLFFCKERIGTVMFVADEDGERAGFLMLLTDVPDDPTQLPQAFVAFVAVEEQRRGRGIGRALVRAAEREARRRDLPHLSLMVGSHNEPARALYASEGFQPERILMTKPLSAAR